MLEYEFMRKALFAGALLGFIIPMMGVVVVNRQTSTIGDALSHTSLAGISLGLLLGFSPVVGAIIACLIGAFSIEAVRRRFPMHGDMATAIVMSAGIGLASVLSDFVATQQNLESYLFGSIIAIADIEIVLTVLISIVVIACFLFFYYPLLYLTVDETGARLSGIKTKVVDSLFTALLAVTIAVASRIVGVLMVSSLMVLPVALSMTFAKSYRQATLGAIGAGFVFVIVGLTISYYWGFQTYRGLKPGGTIVLVGVAALLIGLGIKQLMIKRR